MRILLVLFTFAVGAQASAQETERPVPFDNAGRLVAISSSLATRLGLTMPHWPVVGEYVDAKLYERSGGDFVIAVQKTDGSVDRYPVTAATRRELADILGRSLVASGLATSADRFDVISEPAGNRFVLNQVAAGFLIYGPAAAQVGEGEGSAVMYLLTAGATFFVSSAIANSRTITKAQNSLATDGIWRGALLANGIRYSLRGEASGNEDDDRLTALTSFAGAVTGTIVGFNLGRNLTDGEAAGASFGSTVAAATTAGLIGIAGGFGGDEARGEVGGLVAATLAGYPLGLRYVRRAPYRVTAGDVSTVFTTGLIGALSSAVLVPDNPNGRLVSGILTGGFLAGLGIGDRLLARQFDFTESQAMLVRVGAAAGALMGFALPIAFDIENDRAVLTFGSLGAILGAAATSGIVRPARSK